MDAMAEDKSILGRLLEGDEAQLRSSLHALQNVHASGPLCLEGAADTWRVLFQKLNKATAAPRTRDREIASLVATIAARHFRWGATDLLRARTTAVLGYCRLQAEAAALAHLFLDQPETAQQWFEAVDEAGKQFYRDHQKTLLKIMKKHSLTEAYEKGSGEALHVRVSPVLRGHEIVHEADADQVTFFLRDHELLDDNPLPFLAVASNFFALQACVICALWRGFPEIDQGRFEELGSLATLAQQFDEQITAQHR